MQPDRAEEVRRGQGGRLAVTPSSSPDVRDGPPDRHRPVHVRRPRRGGEKTVLITATTTTGARSRRSTRSSSRPIPDNDAREQALQAGSIDGYDLVAPGDIDSLKQADARSSTGRRSTSLYLGFNVKQNPVDNPKIRQAVAYAINREALVKAKYRAGRRGGQGVHAAGGRRLRQRRRRRTTTTRPRPSSSSPSPASRT